MADIEKTPSPAAPPDPKSGGTIKVHRGIKVHLDARLPALDAGSGYAVEATDGGDRRLYAIVCDPGVPYRHKPMAVLRSKNHKNYVSVVTAARVSPAGSGEERFAIVLNRPAGVTLAKLLGNGEGLGERWIAETVRPQALTALSEFHGFGVTHRALCLNSVFYDADQGTLILGQCVTSPAGSLQPAAFEPLESAAAMAYGRGAGTPAFDTFALGVLLLSLSAGAAPASSDDDRAQLVSRQVESSFAALSGSHKLRGPFADLIRGLMCDSEVQRWGLEEIDAWVHGRRPIALSHRGGRYARFPSRSATIATISSLPSNSTGNPLRRRPSLAKARSMTGCELGCAIHPRPMTSPHAWSMRRQARPKCAPPRRSSLSTPSVLCEAGRSR